MSDALVHEVVQAALSGWVAWLAYGARQHARQAALRSDRRRVDAGHDPERRR